MTLSSLLEGEPEVLYAVSMLGKQSGELWTC